MKSEFEIAFNEILESRALPREMVLEAVRTALISAYRRDAGIGSSQRVEANLDLNSLRPRIVVEKEVVDSVQDNRTEVDLETARFYEPEANLGDMVMVRVEGTMKNFGRIAAQTAKQVVLQKIREAERNSVYDEFSDREGDLVTGTVQSVNSNMATLSLGRAEAILPRAQQIPGEKYKPHDKVRVYIVEVKKGNRGPQIVVSRSHRNMLRRLLEYEVPEIYNGQVEIKNIAREAGYRSKVAVAAQQEGIDPVGACVGMRGVRIQNIVKELHEEKIDVIEWNPNQEIFIAKALSPARVSGVYLEDDPDAGRTAVVIVPDDQLSLAIGREGQNARLAAKLTGWRIDIKSVTEAVQEAIEHIGNPPLKDLRAQQPDMVADVQRIMEKRAANRAVMPEEYTLLNKFADLAQRRYMAAREAARQQRIAQVNAVRSTLPQAAFQMPVSSLDLPDTIIEALQPLETVGEIMLRYLIDERRIQQLLSDAPPDASKRLQAALDKVVFPETPTQEPEATAPVAEVESEEAPVASAPVFGEELDAAATRKDARSTLQPQQPVYIPEETDFEEDEDIDAKGGKGKKGKKKKNRQLIYDEDRGGMVVKRQRKGGRGGDWNNWDE
jgi:transcription termination/antitermination protein NusA